MFRNAVPSFLKYSISLTKRCSSIGQFLFRSICDATEEQSGLVLGVHVSDFYEREQTFSLTETADRFNHAIGSSLHKYTEMSHPMPKLGEGKLFYGLDSKYSTIALVGLGDEFLGYNPVEQIDERKEAIRTAAGVGVRLLQEINLRKVFVESLGHAESAAEGAVMSSSVYQDMKCSQKKIPVKIELFDSHDVIGWKIGLRKGAAQNLARLLTDSKSFNLTPSTFAQTTIEMLSKYGITIKVRMQNWAKKQNFHGLLAASRSSHEPLLLEVNYNGCEPDMSPIVLVGRGVMNHSGSLLSEKDRYWKNGRGDMSGAATVIATIRAIASLQLPINVVGLLPLSVKSPRTKFYRPGDIVRMSNGKAVLVQGTGTEGILQYADVLAYSGKFSPKLLLDIGTMAQNMVSGFNNNVAGVWSNNNDLYKVFHSASVYTGDKIFRFPLWKYSNQNIASDASVDCWHKVLHIIGGEPCKTAAFLGEFIPPHTEWIHIDTFNASYTDGSDFTYLEEGISGRYTRTIVDFLAQLACNEENIKGEIKC